MVKKDELADTTPSTEAISKYIHDEISERRLSYEDIASKSGRARSYVGLRISGLKPCLLTVSKRATRKQAAQPAA